MSFSLFFNWYFSPISKCLLIQTCLWHCKKSATRVLNEAFYRHFFRSLSFFKKKKELVISNSGHFVQKSYRHRNSFYIYNGRPFYEAHFIVNISKVDPLKKLSGLRFMTLEYCQLLLTTERKFFFSNWISDKNDQWTS